MKKRSMINSLVACIILTAGNLEGYSKNPNEESLEYKDWYLMPKIGLAPGVSAHRGFIQRVSPLGGFFDGQQAIACATFGGITAPSIVIENQWNVFQQEVCPMPKFNQFYHNSVLHVGFELGRNICDNTQMYFEFTYDRARSKCYADTSPIISAPNGCSSGCSQDCSTSSEILLAPSIEIDITLSTYSAYGFFAGARYYFDLPFLCNRISPWVGFKAGLLHRKAIDVCASIASFTETIEGVGTYAFPGVSGLSARPFCKSTCAASGLSLGFNYCWRECLTLLFGFEVVASSPFKGSPNIRIPVQPFITPVGSSPEIPGTFLPQATNVIPGNTGTLVQFPIWAGLQWEFDFCIPFCNPCA